MNLAQKARGFAFLLGVAATILVAYALPRYAILDGTLSLRDAVIICATTYLVSGITLGFVWPNQGWRLGLWIAGPSWLLVLLSLLFAGYVNKFFTNDLPLLASSVVAASLGAYIGAYLGSLVHKKKQEAP